MSAPFDVTVGNAPRDVLYPGPVTAVGMAMRMEVADLERFTLGTGWRWAIERAVRGRPRWDLTDVFAAVLAPRKRRKRRR